jgi:hypothetical protein
MIENNEREVTVDAEVESTGNDRGLLLRRPTALKLTVSAEASAVPRFELGTYRPHSVQARLLK